MTAGIAGRAPPSDHNGRSAAVAWYGLAVLVAVALFAFVDRQILNLIAPLLQRQWGLSDLQLGALQGVGLGLFGSAAGYPVGWLADRFGRRRVLAACLALWAVSTAACAFQTSFTGLFVVTAGIGIGEAALAPVIFGIIPDLFPERQRNTANFIFWGAVCFGSAAGMGVGGLMLEWLTVHARALPGPLAAMASWRLALLFVAAPAPLFLLLLATLRERRGERPAGLGPSADQVLPFVRRHGALLLGLYAVIAGYTLPLMAGFTWLPVAIPRLYGVAVATAGMQIGLVLAAASLAGILLPLIGNRLPFGAARLRPLRLSLSFLIAAIVPAAALPFASSPNQVYAAIGAQTGFALAMGALMPGLIQQIAPPALRSRLLAILGIVIAGAAGLSPLLVGALSGLLPDERGILLAIAIVSTPSWAIAAVILLAVRRRFASLADEPHPSLERPSS